MIDVKQRTIEHAVSLEGGWNRDVVRKPLWEHYNRKCYLCECEIQFSEFQVDHRVPQAACPAFVSFWFNLFPACGSCNIRRPQFPKHGGLLSPGLDRRVEDRLRQQIERISSTEIRARFTAADDDDVYAHNTAQELESIHSPESGTTDTVRARALDLLDAIQRRYWKKIYPIEMRALQARRRGQPDREAEAKLRRKLARTEPYTMLLRSMLHDELRDLLDN